MKRFLFAALGSIALALGIIGVFLPLLPTTPFLLLAAALYFRSSQRLYNWLLNHPHLGVYIRNFREHRAIPIRVKIVSVTLVWVTLLNCALFIAEVWWLRLLFILLATAITVHILRYKTLRKE
ncbi:MAG: YbaN family protein [Bacteroidaceae bacterium]|nr:YbaN family protein [Bacteroidaceae bacterium]